MIVLRGGGAIMSTRKCWRKCFLQLKDAWHYSNVRRCSFKSILSSDLSEKRQITVKGWVKSVRDHKDVSFLEMSDGSCRSHIQVVIPSDKRTCGATLGSCIQVQGTLQPSTGKGQTVEVVAENIDVLGPCDGNDFPFKARKRHPVDYARQYLHLRPRTNMFSSLLRLRSAASHAVHEFFKEECFLQVHTPILTSNDCEGAGEAFLVQTSEDVSQRNVGESAANERQSFFKVPSYLTVSGQLHLEVMTGAFTKVYTFNPTFRAEKSGGRHHLSEFYMIEAELAFVANQEDLMQVIERMLKKVSEKVLATQSEDVALFMDHVAPPGHEQLLDKLMREQYVRMSYTEAIGILEEARKQFKFQPKWGRDLQKEHERHLVEHCGNTPVFVTDFPASLKPFYARINDDAKTVAAVDLLGAGVGEVCGGSLREERLEYIEESLAKFAQTDAYDWYVDLRRFGSVPHGGFGVGFERYLQLLLGIANIKDVIPFPRFLHHCEL